MRLGDLDTLKAWLKEYWQWLDDNDFSDGVYHAIELLNNAPTIDAVPVVRCKDCRNGKPCRDGYVLCSHPAGKRLLMTSSDFCSYGEQKDGEG